MKEARGTCWVGYKQVGMKDKGGRKVPNCVKETTEISPDALPHIKSDYIISPNYLYIIITD